MLLFLFADRGAKDAEWRAVHRIADGLTPATRVRVRRALGKLRMPVGFERAYRSEGPAALDRFSFDGLMQGLELIVMPALRTAYGRMFKRTVRTLPQVLSKAQVDERDFVGTNPFATLWAAEKSSEFVTGVTETTRRGIRTYVERAFVEGIPPRTLARQLRDIVGLAPRQAIAVQNLIAQGATPRQASRYAQRLLRERTESIARTEIMASSNAGQLDAWRDAQSRGRFPVTMLREFIVTPDDRLCPICAPLDAEQVGMDEVFSFGRMYPPVHPRCRCTVGLMRAQDVTRRRVAPDRGRDLNVRRMLTSHGDAGTAEHVAKVEATLRAETTRLLQFSKIKDIDLPSSVLVHEEPNIRGGLGWYFSGGPRNRAIDVADGPKRAAIADTYSLSTASKTRWIVNDSVVGVYRHEFGHMVHLSSMSSELFSEWLAIWENRELTNGISTYANTNHKEYFAEAFAAYTHPDYRGDLPEPVHEFMKRSVGFRRKKKG